MSSLCDGIEDCSNGEDEVSIHCLALAPHDTINLNALMEPEHSSVGYLKVQDVTFLCLGLKTSKEEDWF